MDISSSGEYFINNINTNSKKSRRKMYVNNEKAAKRDDIRAGFIDMVEYNI